MYTICVCKREEEGDGGEAGSGGCLLGIRFPGGRKEVVSTKNTNNEIALTEIPFSLSQRRQEKENKSSSFYEAGDRIEDKPLSVAYI